ncbi:LuxR family transcriptional regulator [Paenirhodobacter sp.]|uniref:LuxR family transcriptional regulator n=1 Tax=Paenirhodobacter sp. TaxID=1965326 RepID=UPI003B50CA93
MLEHLEKVLLSDDVETIWSMHCSLMAQYGFDRLIYAFIPYRAVPGHDDIADALILSNYDTAYLRSFLHEKMFLESPMVRWTMSNTGVCSWNWVEDQRRLGLLSETEQQVLRINAAHGVIAGYSIAFADSSARSKGGIGLCAERGLSQTEVDDIWARHERELMVLNLIVHLKISNLPLVTARRALTVRQREVLEWVADGKTIADIALIMGLTVATVEKHLRLAREALDVETTAQAVLKATMQKQLFLRGGYQNHVLNPAIAEGEK